MKTQTAYREEIKNLRAQLLDIRDRCITENRNPSDEEIGQQNVIMDRIENIKKIIAVEERREALDESLATPTGQTYRTPITGEERATKDKFKTPTEFYYAVMQAAAPQPFIDPRLKNAASGLQEGVPSDGGFLVQTDIASRLLDKTYETGQVSSRCTRYPLGANSNGINIPGIDETSRVAGSRSGGVLAYWQGEADLKVGSKPKLRMVELKVKKLTGLCYATDEMMQDATALSSIIEQKFSQEFAFRLDDACINGTGAGMPLGIMNAPCIVQVNKEAGQVAATVVYENIVNMWSRMWARSRTNAVWFINQDVEPQLFTMGISVGTGGMPVYMPPGGASAAPYGTLFGRPVIPIEQCQTLGTAGDIILADMSEYILVDKGAMDSAVSIHVRFIYDEQTFRFVYRVDGQPGWNSALTPFKGSNTLSPFIRLQTRS